MNKPAKVSPDKRTVIAQAMRAGADQAAIRSALIESGTSPAAADYEVKRLEKDPVFQAAAEMRRGIAKRDWLLAMYGTLDASSRGEPVPTIDRIDPERFHEDFYARNRPVKLTGLIAHWPALSLWSLDYLEQQVGDAPVELQGQRGSNANYEIDSPAHKRMLPMREVIAAIREIGSTNDFYITANNGSTNRQTLSRLWDDLAPVSILESGTDRDGFFWLGPKGTLTPLHHDLTNNLLVQVMGRKRVRLIAPWELPRVRNHLHVFSELTLAELQSKLPDLPRQREVEIGPGDALFLPVGWWHHVEALDASISMSFTNFPVDNDFTGGHPA